MSFVKHSVCCLSRGIHSNFMASFTFEWTNIRVLQPLVPRISIYAYSNYSQMTDIYVNAVSSVFLRNLSFASSLFGERGVPKAHRRLDCQLAFAFQRHSIQSMLRTPGGYIRLYGVKQKCQRQVANGMSVGHWVILCNWNQANRSQNTARFYAILITCTMRFQPTDFDNWCRPNCYMSC